MCSCAVWVIQIIYIPRTTSWSPPLHPPTPTTYKHKHQVSFNLHPVVNFHSRLSFSNRPPHTQFPPQKNACFCIANFIIAPNYIYWQIKHNVSPIFAMSFSKYVARAFLCGWYFLDFGCECVCVELKWRVAQWNWGEVDNLVKKKKKNQNDFSLFWTKT